MSKMEELVHEISFTVEKLTSRITEEKEKIKQFNENRKRALEEYDRIKLNNEQLKMDIEQLQQTFFRESQQSRSLSTANDLVEKRLQTLTKAVDDIRAAGEKMRTERLRVLNEFREKINEYEQILQKNDILLQFVEKWRENAENNRDLIGLVTFKIYPYFSLSWNNTKSVTFYLHFHNT
uniref:Uncharacterized protein n=1 Tax=Schistocephalus solidus TaxID=70667 RepID=A0A0V0J5Z1_SCHSO